MVKCSLMRMSPKPEVVAPAVELEACPRVGELVECVETVKAQGTSVWRVEQVMHKAGGGTSLVVVPS